MTKIKCFLVTYDRLYDKVIDQLSSDELETINCYQIQKKVDKNISSLIKNNIKEWELPWNNYHYQSKQYYEYGTMIHLLNNPMLIEDCTHIGLFHYDVIFNKGSINSVYDIITKDPNVIFYQKKRGIEDLYLTPYELKNICEFMSEKMNINVNPSLIWNDGWFSEALSITPKEVFIKFAKFLETHHDEIENILISNRWGIMDRIKHRVCGIVERMWGFYLASHQLNKYELNVKHDWDSYIHKHSSEANWITI